MIMHGQCCMGMPSKGANWPADGTCTGRRLLPAAGAVCQQCRHDSMMQISAI
jgi:hypothetical protein